MARQISLPPEIVTSDKTPRSAIAFDKTSGVKQVADTARAELLVGQRLVAGSQAVNTPVDIYRETAGEALFGQGSALDVAIKAAFKAHPYVKLTAVAVDDAIGSVAATATLTFAVNAAYDGYYALRVMGVTVLIPITKADTPTVIAASGAAAINAIKDLPVTAAAALGVITLTARNKGALGNGIQLRGDFSRSDIATTATLSGPSLTGGAGVASLANALAACAGARYHVVVPLLDDSASGQAARDHVEMQSDGEHGLGEISIQAINGTLSTATTLSAALNGYRSQIYATNASESWFVQIAAAAGAVESSEEVATRPRNTLELKGIIAPPVASRWLYHTETRALLDNGVSPLVVRPGERVSILRAVSTYTRNASGDPDYSVLDITTALGFDYFRDNIALMFDTNYARSRWAEDQAEDDLPPDVATPSKVGLDLLNVARDMEALGIVSHVEQHAAEFVVNKVGTQCQFSVPAEIVEGLHEKLGKVVLIRRPFAA
jgi:phage tail sheath gpL-like